MLRLQLNFSKLKNRQFLCFNQYFFSQQKLKKEPFNQIQIKVTDSAQSILKRYRKNQDWVYRNNMLFQWFRHAINQSCKGNKNKFNQLLKLTSTIHISKYDSWRALHQISQQLKKLFNWRNFIQKKLKQKEEISILQLLKLSKNFNYELKQEQDTNFIDQIKVFINATKNKQNLREMFQIFQTCLRQNKVLKLIQPQKLQKSIKQIILSKNITQKQLFSVSNIIKEGLISQFWTDNFLLQILQIIQKEYFNAEKTVISAKNAIKFSKYQIFSNQVSQSTSEKSGRNSQTEEKISLILSQLDYNFSSGKRIFNFQLDYTIGDNVIIQYHGIHHYTTNHFQPVETLKSKWKKQILQKRGFKVLIIPFYQWKQLNNIYEKKIFLISKIQNFILENLTSKSNKQY